MIVKHSQHCAVCVRDLIECRLQRDSTPRLQPRVSVLLALTALVREQVFTVKSDFRKWRNPQFWKKSLCFVNVMKIYESLCRKAGAHLFFYITLVNVKAKEVMYHALVSAFAAAELDKPQYQHRLLARCARPPPSWGIWQTYPILKINHCRIECKMFALCTW